MGTQYLCDNSKRRQKLAEDGTAVNGIDFLEVLDTRAPSSSARQRTLLVRFFKPVAGLGTDNVRITGGVRVSSVRVLAAWRADQAMPAELHAPATEQSFFQSLPQPEKVLVVRTDSTGDFSTYRLSIVDPAKDGRAPAGFDAPSCAVDFSFKVESPSEFDPRPAGSAAPLPSAAAVSLDYLAKDYASFRRLMLDRLAVVMPEWKERNPADLGVALVEVLAYAADRLSYYQDSVANEGYLGTARHRVSVRRHARLLDYVVHDGCNARAWVRLPCDVGVDGRTLPAGTLLLTRVDAPPGPLTAERTQEALLQGAQPFETMEALELYSEHNTLSLYTWGGGDCCLPRGATRATLVDPYPAGTEPTLRPGTVLVLAQVRDPRTGFIQDADPTRRHVVRLTGVQRARDELLNKDVLEIQWADDDALPFALELGEDEAPAAVAWGNVVLVDHGYSLLAGEVLPPLPEQGRYRPGLSRGPLTQQGHVSDREGRPVLVDPRGSARSALQWGVETARPVIRLVDPEAEEQTWVPMRELLDSDRFSPHFVVESEDDGSAFLRFGDGVLGREPRGGLVAWYRVGNGPAGNVGAETIAHVALHPTNGVLNATLAGILEVSNPLPAVGGLEPESLEHVRQNAPFIFQKQERAVTSEDFARAAERHPDVQKAVATRRWTGSWPTLYITVDRYGGRPVDDAFKAELRAFLERFRLAGHDLEVISPVFVPLDIGLTVGVAPGYFRGDIQAELLQVFGSGLLPGGGRAFFHPDNFTFGQSVYLSQLIHAIMQVPGVAWVDTSEGARLRRFQRFGQVANQELQTGAIYVKSLEIIRLDNDPNRPENGRIAFLLEGGL